MNIYVDKMPPLAEACVISKGVLNSVCHITEGLCVYFGGAFCPLIPLADHDREKDEEIKCMKEIAKEHADMSDENAIRANAAERRAEVTERALKNILRYLNAYEAYQTHIDRAADELAEEDKNGKII
jgi:hypothetical protein